MKCSALPLAIAITLAAGCQGDRKQPEMRADGTALVTTGQVLTPYGLVRRIEGARAKDLALSRDGEMVATLCNGRIVFYSRTGEPQGEVVAGTGAVGIAFGARGEVYASTNQGGVHLLQKVDGKWALAATHLVDTEPKGHGNPQVNGLAVSADGGTLTVALGRRNKIQDYDISPLAGDPKAKPVLVRTREVEIAPYRLIEAAGAHIVANRGGSAPTEAQAKADSSGTMVAIDPGTDAALRGSVTVLPGGGGEAQHIEIGRQPSGLSVSPDGTKLAVACSDDDNLAVWDLKAGRFVLTRSQRPAVESDSFGTIPTDVVWDADGKTAYVTCGGLNAVAVVDMENQGRAKGYIPTAHFPIAVKRSGNTLIVASSKGLGNRIAGKTTRFGVHDNVGTVQFIDLAKAKAELDALTLQVAQNNQYRAELPAREGQPARPVPERVGEPSVFKHVVYIIKENLTYDSVLGDMKEGNGDPSLCLFPENVSPNHHALAREFALLDNVYTSGTNSADGHQWTSTAIANGYIEQNYASAIRSYPYDGGDPLAFSPEGFLWTAAMDQGISVRVYGEFVDKPVVLDPATKKAPTFKQLWDAYKAGEDKYEIRAETSQAALRKVLHPRFIGFPSIVSDQWRADQFLAEFREWEKEGKMPEFLIFLFPNDHTAGTSPGMPTPRAAVADNDLALGRVVEAISKSRFWKETLILVIEDDSQLGLDHVDGHRTVGYAISPYTKRATVVSDMYNHTSFIRTMGLVLGFPALTRFDRGATPLTSVFTDKPDLKPYTHRPANIPLDELNPPRNQLKGEALKWATASEKLNWKGVDLADATTVARAVWHSQMKSRPFPWDMFRPNLDED